MGWWTRRKTRQTFERSNDPVEVAGAMASLLGEDLGLPRDRGQVVEVDHFSIDDGSPAVRILVQPEEEAGKTWDGQLLAFFLFHRTDLAGTLQGQHVTVQWRPVRDDEGQALRRVHKITHLGEPLIPPPNALSP